RAARRVCFPSIRAVDAAGLEAASRFGHPARMFARIGLSTIALAAAACSAEPQASAPSKPQIPAALRGCWELRQAPDAEYPDGLSEVMMVEADRIAIDAKG